MQLIHTVEILRKEIKARLDQGLSVGFVPTMGALHAGHIELVKRSVRENGCTVVSVFVNPTQFNDPKDLERYPRTLEADCELLQGAGCEIVFAPSVQEVYPVMERPEFDFGVLGSVMEGACRPGHFDGVAQVVGRLFDLVTPHRAYFGEKDFQQLAIIQEFVKREGYPLEIVPCPIVRQEDGLALSSRNKLLTTEGRAAAPTIYKILSQSREMARTMPLAEVREWVIAQLNSEKMFRLEYFEIVDALTLCFLNEWKESESPVGCVALFCGEIRLIDNIRY